jgi:hypothetical protein
MNSSTRQRVLRTHMLSRFVIPSFDFRLLIQNHVTGRKRTNSSVSPNQIGERSFVGRADFAAFSHMCLRRFHMPASCIRMLSTCSSYGKSRAILKQNRSSISLLKCSDMRFRGAQIDTCVMGTVRSSEILLGLSVICFMRGPQSSRWKGGARLRRLERDCSCGDICTPSLACSLSRTKHGSEWSSRVIAAGGRPTR